MPKSASAERRFLDGSIRLSALNSITDHCVLLGMSAGKPCRRGDARDERQAPTNYSVVVQLPNLKD
jgi:hypothetical protein